MYYLHQGRKQLEQKRNQTSHIFSYFRQLGRPGFCDVSFDKGIYRRTLKGNE